LKPPVLQENRPYVINTAIRQLAQGRNNATGSVTLAASVTSTVVTSDIVNDTDTVLLSPMTANAAAEIGAGTAYVSAVAKGSFTITHANAVSTDRTFRYAVFGG
jgi:bifunctional N-acetylglucosamine-1-phosphate-uridyltransferase/glucosamine-1-phosphate-acetyltransferase GlmU-like protein